MTTTLQFNRKDLLYDIANCGFVIADLLPRDETNKSIHIADIIQDGNVDIVTRKMDVAYFACKELLRSWTKSDPVDGGVLNNEFVEREQYSIVLTYPEGVTMGTLENLNALVHEYMVARIIYEWLSINNREEMPIWYDKFTKIATSISACLSARGRATFRKVGPYW